VKLVDGEVWLGGPSLAEGYLGDPELTAERFVEDGGVRWFRTADGGELSTGPDGRHLTVTGRRDDVLISGGVKVALAAVERVLRELPGYGDAIVVSVPDERWGEVPVAVTANAGVATSDVSDAEAAAVVAAALGTPARPARFLHLGALPLLPSGKVDRLAVRAIALGASR
jgi:O-succinylbenzoic acid--CoA ligase